MSSGGDDEAIFPRSFVRQTLTAVRGQGVYIEDADGKRYLDACGGSAVVAIGHGVQEVVAVLSEQASRLAYVHSSQFYAPVAYELASFLQGKFPDRSQNVRVHFTSGGSEAIETAVKIVRQYWLSRNQPQRTRILSRRQSYHGATLGALALSGSLRRRRPFEPLLPPVDHISACFCYRCPLGLEFPACDLACGQELEQAITKVGPDKVAGFILEPVVGASSGAVPPEGYLRLVREICDRHGILLIADEVMTGAGRTGTYFAVEHWNLVPDIILLGKGLTSGYAPLGAVLAGEKVWRQIQQGTGGLDHGFTYQAHPPSVATGLAVQRYIEKNALVDRARDRGAYLAKRLEELRALPCVGDVRGKGLLQTVEFVADKKTCEPFPAEVKFSDRLFDALQERGVVVYPMRGIADGNKGDHILIAPPFIIEEQQIDFLVEQIAAALQEMGQETG
jgi:adenosylmethionine-8-amino-7-oxononanoate aminotransferase